MKHITAFLLLLTIFQRAGAQTPVLLRPEEAVSIALANNFDILLAQGAAESAQINNTKGNAGMLPAVNLVASENFSVNSFQQKLRNGTEFNQPGALFNTANAGVQLNWTLFDGRRMFIAKKRLEELEALGQLNLKGAVEQTAAAVLQTYYEIARSRMQEKALQEVIELNEERLRIAEARLAAGFAAQTDALQARIDLNQRRGDLLNQQQVTTAAKRGLNQLLARDPETTFEVSETIAGDYNPDQAALTEKIMSQNAVLLSLQKSADIAALSLDETHTLNKPRITGIGQFNGVRSDNGAGFLINNTQAGLTIGASFTMPLYAGGNIKRQQELAKVETRLAAVRIDAQRNVISSEVANQLAFFQTQRQILQLEEANVTNARENLMVSTERFRLGQTNSLEVQNAQNSLEQTLARRNLLLYNLKLAEIRLKLLAGEING